MGLFILINGYPGVGKLTIAKELAYVLGIFLRSILAFVLSDFIHFFQASYCRMRKFSTTTSRSTLLRHFISALTQNTNLCARHWSVTSPDQPPLHSHLSNSAKSSFLPLPRARALETSRGYSQNNSPPVLVEQPP